MVVLVLDEQVRHHRYAGIASVIQARKPKPGFERFEQRKVIVVDVALEALRSIVLVHDGQHLVGTGRYAVVIFVPQNDDGSAAFLPDSGSVDGADQNAQFLVANGHQRRVESDLASVVVRIEVALRSSIAATMLIGALIRGDEGIVRDIVRFEVGEQAIGALEAGDAATARDMQRLWYPLRARAREFGQPQTTKAAMNLRGFDGGSVRLPLRNLDTTDIKDIAKVLRELAADRRSSVALAA